MSVRERWHRWQWVAHGLLFVFFVWGGATLLGIAAVEFGITPASPTWQEVATETFRRFHERMWMYWLATAGSVYFAARRFIRAKQTFRARVTA